VSYPEAKPEPAALRTPSLAVVRPTSTDPLSRRLDGLLAEARALGAQADVLDAGDGPERADHDVVIVDPRVDVGAARSLVAVRTEPGKATIVDVVDPTASAALIAVCDAATAPTPAVCTAVRNLGRPALLLPPLVERARIEELRVARVPGVDERILGVRIETRAPGDAAALSTAVLDLLSRDDGLLVECTGARAHVPMQLVEDPRVEHVDDVDLRRCARWTAQAWIGPPGAPEAFGRPAALIETSFLGVPSVFTRSGGGDVTDPVLASGALSEPTSTTSWAAAFAAVLDRASASERERLAARAELLYGVKAGASIVSRVLGWASEEVGKR
jgi:hypothetical protein